MLRYISIFSRHTPQAQGYRKELDGLRAIAVTAVILFHAGVAQIAGGFVGVDIFFVISGYLITGMINREIADRNFSVLIFYERRIRRIAPAFFVVIAATVIAGSVILTPAEFGALGEEALSASLFSSNIMFWQDSGYFSPDAATRPLLHTWSLGVEEQFYIVFPLVLWIACRFFRPWLIAGMFMLGLSSFLLSIYAVHCFPSAAFYLLPSRAWELLVGSFVALTPRLQGRKLGPLVSTLGICASLWAVLVYTDGTPFPGTSAVLPVFGAAAIISVRDGGWVYRLLASEPLIYLGKRSFSLYLWHWPIFVFVRMLLGQSLSPGQTVGALVTILLVAHISWRYIETPFRRMRTRPKIWLLGSSLTVGTIAASMYIIMMQGFPSRFPSPVLRTLAFADDEKNSLENGYNCVNSFVNSKYGSCAIGKTGAVVDIVVLGDSHAMSLHAAFNEVFLANNIVGRLVSVPGCPPLFGIERVNYSIDCPKELLAAKTYIAITKPKATILVGAWRGVLFSKDTKFRGSVSDDDRTRLINIGAAMSETVSFLHGADIVVAALMPVPGSKMDVPTSVVRALADATFDIQEYNHDYSSLMATMKGAGVDLIGEPANTFCSPECRIFNDDGLPLYVDQGHLTSVGDELAEPAIEVVSVELLRRLLPPNTLDGQMPIARQRSSLSGVTAE